MPQGQCPRPGIPGVQLAHLLASRPSQPETDWRAAVVQRFGRVVRARKPERRFWLSGLRPPPCCSGSHRTGDLSRLPVPAHRMPPCPCKTRS